MSKKMPKRLFVVMGEIDNDSLPIASNTIEDFHHGDVVGLYELVETSTLKVRRELTKAKAKKRSK